jgi:hypothetical protein
VPQQGSGPPRPGAAEDEEYPSWAIPSQSRSPRPAAPSHRDRRDHRDRTDQRDLPDVVDEREPRAHRRVPVPGRRRSQATRARRNKRRLIVLGGLAGVAVLITVLVIVLPGSKPASSGLNDFVTTYQPGELRSVPNVCQTVAPGTLGQYLPGKLAMVNLPGLSGKTSNQCDWTLDHKPMYRLLQVTATAYAPSGLASGDGSATDAATDAYTQTLQGYQHPPKSAHQPQPQIVTVHGLGQTAFSASQVITVGAGTKASATTDRVTIVARYRNVLITVEFSGLEHASQGGYGPVSPSLLQAGAGAAARDVLQKV